MRRALLWLVLLVIGVGGALYLHRVGGRVEIEVGKHMIGMSFPVALILLAALFAALTAAPGFRMAREAIHLEISLDGTRHAVVVEPLLDWTPSIGASGLAFYNASAFPGWRGSFLAGGLVGQNVDRVVVASDGSARRETILKDQGRVRDVRVGPDGFVYVAFDAGGEDKAGRVVRLRPAGAK